MTKLEAFLRSRGVKPLHLARESGYSRQHLLRVRMGRMEPTRRCIASIVAALRRLTHEHVRATDLFDLED
jgi:predicted transcriptional regulator